jgi:hypothetical protein
MKEIVFEVAQEGDGGFTGEALGECIFTQADNWDELRANVREAVQAFYFDSEPHASIRLRFGVKCWLWHEAGAGFKRWGRQVSRHRRNGR